MKIIALYDLLWRRYGPQGWWPLLKKNSSGIWVCTYYPSNYDIPNTDEEKFEIALGTVLTQNTNWKNVVKALSNLKEQNLIKPELLLNTPNEKLKEYIKPSGYYNQKAKKIVELCRFWLGIKQPPERKDLLKVWGIGPETADSILLYAFKKPVMVIDSYTHRCFEFWNICSANHDYYFLQNICHKALGVDYRIFQEFHALLVTEAKTIIKSKNRADTSPVLP